MNKITKEDLELHKEWLIDNAKGRRLVRIGANLSNAYLSNAYLSNADLRYANLRHAKLSNANLSYADLSYANLSYANLSNADLSNADLSNADLNNAGLRHANLSNANLSNADLDFAQFSLSCKTRDIKVCNRLPFQLAWHICSMISDDKEVQELQELLKPFANKSHLIEEHDLPKFELKENTK